LSELKLKRSGFELLMVNTISKERFEKMFAVDKQIGSGEEQIIYEHFLYSVRNEDYTTTLDRFQRLFIDGLGYSDAKIWNTIERIITSKTAERDFPLVLNRCCYIAINYWQMQIDCDEGIRKLIYLLEELPRQKTVTYAKLPRRLGQLVHLYVKSPDFERLQRLKAVVSAGKFVAKPDEQQPLRVLITRYPYLYEHSLVTDNRSKENVDTVQRLQAEAQQVAEHQLSQYLSYQVRRSRMIAQHGREALKDLPLVPNPTLLSTKELGMAFGHFAGKVEGEFTHRDLSQRMRMKMAEKPTVGSFKDDFYRYLTSSVDPNYGQRGFNDRVLKILKNISPDRDRQPLDEIALLRTCTHLLNHLVVESKDKPQHFVFADLLTNVGTVFTTGMLLKIVSICYKAKPILENRLSILFGRYETLACNQNPWLVKVLENWNVANSIHFGKVDANAIDFIAKLGSN
jgi:hypothetical protein